MKTYNQGYQKFSVQAANTGQSEAQGKHYENWISYEDKQWY